MSQNVYGNILNQVTSPIKNNNQLNNPTNETKVEVINNNKIPNLFNVDLFVEDVKIKTEQINKEQALNTYNISSYAIAHDCIREAFFRILDYPAKSYQNQYVPIRLKATLGNAIHEFIQSHSSIFTELEASIKVPSIRMSCRIDALIDNNVIIEIKSCNFKDYESILKNKKPRDSDFLQVALYKYLLENHLEEAKKQTNTRTQVPKLDKYNIEYFQFIYVANDILSAESNTLSEALNDVNKVKKLLDSKHNQFYFINTVTLDLKTFDINPYYTWIINKINYLNNYLNNNKIPPLTDPYINNKSCFFCIYKDICKQYK